MPHASRQIPRGIVPRLGFRAVAVLLAVLFAAADRRLASLETRSVPVHAGLAQVATASPMPTPGPPDLVPSFSFEFPRCEPRFGMLQGQFGYRPCILNAGGTEARDFIVRFGEGAAAEDVAVPQLDAGGRLCLAPRYNMPAVIDVDPDDRVAESDETNNRLEVLPPPQTRPPRCTPGPPPTATPVPPPLPNLSGSARWWMDLPEGCIPLDEPLPPILSEITVRNDGIRDAGPFDAASSPPSSRRWAFEGLPAGATYTRGPGPLDFSHVAIDPDERVRESDEGDNDVYVPVPTLPPYCPTATSTPEPGSPTPTSVTTATSTSTVPPRHIVHVPFAAKAALLARD